MRPLRAAMEERLLRSFAGLINQLRQQDFGIERYIWRSQDDAKVCDSHAEFYDQVFRWDDPPAGGHRTPASMCDRNPWRRPRIGRGAPCRDGPRVGAGNGYLRSRVKFGQDVDQGEGPLEPVCTPQKNLRRNLMREISPRDICYIRKRKEEFLERREIAGMGCLPIRRSRDDPSRDILPQTAEP
ncbi:hypothetical protein [Thioclava sp. A2]|uniref:hypothetical protein n=1 Tax=Thioclava sp. FCG-A2 TaxID=3080562 RepID=UPI00398834F8